MKKYYAILFAAVMLAACAREEQPEVIGQAETPAAYTLSVKAAKGNLTRGLSLDDHTLEATWDGTEEVSVFLAEEQIGTLTPATSTTPGSNECTLVGDFLTPPSIGNVLVLRLNSEDYSGQDGTLAYIAGNCDCAVATITVDDIVGNEILIQEEAADFESRQAIVKFTLTDNSDSPAALSPSSFTLSVGTTTVELTDIPAATYTANEASNVLFVAVPGFESQTVTLTAVVGEDTYTYEKSGLTLANGRYYEIKVKMTKAPSYDRVVNLSEFIGDKVYVTAGEHWNITGTSTKPIVILEGATVTLGGVNIASPYNNPISCSGNATIILAEGTENTLTAPSDRAGILIGPTGSTLTIDGTGTLIVQGGESGAGIGTDANIGRTSDIIILGGNITATGGTNAAGIGAGGQSCGDITISGGTINATGTATSGSTSAAGIGSSNANSCRNITISGGIITATGGNRGGAGIGSAANYSCGDILITGGTIKAKGGRNSAGIGCYSKECGTITITEGVTSVEATKSGTSPDPIGKGSSTSTCGLVTIDGVKNPTASSEFPNLILDPSDGYTWTLTHK